MFAVILTYKTSQEEIERHTPAHREFLDRYYASGVLLISGRQNSQRGGVILARTESREALDKILAEDPFAVAGVADYAVYEFTPAKFQPCLKEWLEA